MDVALQSKAKSESEAQDALIEYKEGGKKKLENESIQELDAVEKKSAEA